MNTRPLLPAAASSGQEGGGHGSDGHPLLTFPLAAGCRSFPRRRAAWGAEGTLVERAPVPPFPGSTEHPQARGSGRGRPAQRRAAPRPRAPGPLHFKVLTPGPSVSRPAQDPALDYG